MITTGGEWNLIHSRNIVLYEKYDIKIKMNVLLPAQSFEGDLIHFKRAPYPIEIILCSRTRRDIINSVNNLYLKAVQKDYKAILGDDTGYALFATKNLKLYRGKLIIDMHGDLAELYEYSPRKRYLYGLMRYWVFSFQQRRFIQNCDAALVVSSLLHRYARHVNPDTKIYKVPCACNEVLSYDEYRINRKYWRERLHIGNDDIVLAYAGGLSKWQALNEHLEIVSGCCNRDMRIRGLFFTSEVMTLNNTIESKYAKFKNRFSVMSVDNNALVKALCAADVGLLVRRQDKTNNAAFPNKFDEYLAAGLKVITTPALLDISKIISENRDIGLLINYDNIISEIEKILSFANKDFPITSDRFRETQKLRKSFNFENSLKEFAEFLKE